MSGRSGSSSRRVSKGGAKRPGVTKKKGEAKKRKALRSHNVGRGRVRGRQSGGGGKGSRFSARPIGRTSRVALAGTAPIEVPAGPKTRPRDERGARGFCKTKPPLNRERVPGASRTGR